MMGFVFPQVVQPDIYAKNGFVHIVDKVLGPSIEPSLPKIDRQRVSSQTADLRIAINAGPEIEPTEIEPDTEEKFVSQELEQPLESSQEDFESGPSSGSSVVTSRSIGEASTSVSTESTTSSSVVITNGGTPTESQGEDTPDVLSSSTDQPDVSTGSRGTPRATVGTPEDAAPPGPGGLIWSTNEPASSGFEAGGDSNWIRTG